MVHIEQARTDPALEEVNIYHTVEILQVLYLESKVNNMLVSKFFNCFTFIVSFISVTSYLRKVNS